MSKTTFFVIAYLLVRTVLWTLLIFFTQPTLPLDVLEHLAWGREWRLVYAHHPGLPAWIDEALNVVTGGSHLALSVTAPLSTSATMLAVWALARRVTDSRRALAALLALEGISYFNQNSMDFNHNIISLPILAWLFYLTHRAFCDVQQVPAPKKPAGNGIWLLLGAVAALSLYAKYSSVLFLLSVFAWSMMASPARLYWRTSGPWLAVAVFTVLTLPQIVTLIDIHFGPLDFVMQRFEHAAQWTDYIWHPLRFALGQLKAVLLALLLCILSIGKRRGREVAEMSVTALTLTNRRYVAVIALGPLILAVLIAAVGGWEFHTGWGTMMVSFIPLWFLIKFTAREFLWRRFYVGALSVALLAMIAPIIINIGGPYLTGYAKRIHYPAHDIANYVGEQWQAAFNTPLRYVTGDDHMSRLVAFYAPSRPSVIIEGNYKKSFWVTPNDFAKCGGAIVWLIDDRKNRKNIPAPAFSQEYPSARYVPPLTVDWKTAAKIPPAKVGLLLVPPGESGC